MDKTELGNRMKWYEKRLETRLMPLVPVLARIDGRCFSKFTNGLERPYDVRMSRLMIDTTRQLVEQTNASCGYTQSDEISLVWYTTKPTAEMFFGGKSSKLISITAALTSTIFNKLLPQYLPEKVSEWPIFDSRVWELPNPTEAANYFVWREQDATRNSVQMAAHTIFSHQQCHQKNSSELQEMLMQRDINWNNYPPFFKRGTYVRKRVIERPFTQEEIDTLPAKHHARTNPHLIIRRSVVAREDFPPLTQIENKEEVLLLGKDIYGE